GTGFSGNMTDNVVTFAGTNNTSVLSPVTAGTATSLQVTVPDGAVTGPVVVRSGQQSSIGVTFTVPAVNPVPSEISISPSNVAAGIHSIDLWLSRNGLMTNSIVNYLRLAMPITFVDSTILGITIPTHVLSMGIHAIQVVN